MMEKDRRAPSVTMLKTRRKILVIEDNEDQLRMLQMALMQAGYSVVTAVAGEQALGYVQITAGTKAAVDLILLDYTLPNSIDGMEILKRLKGRPDTAGIRVIILSGYLNDERVGLLLQEGAAGCITKPFKLPALIDTVGQALQAREDRRRHPRPSAETV